MNTKTRNALKLTQFQENALIGSMLGDGNLTLKNRQKNAYFRVSRSIKDIDYLEFEANIFQNFLLPSVIFNGLRKEKNRDTITFTTIAAQIFNQFYNQWYPNDKKIVPLDLKLNPQIIAHWFVDDGHITTNNSENRFMIHFATCGFTLTEVKFLANLLSARYNEDFNVLSLNKNPYIRCYDNASRALIKDIDQFVKMDRKRIWENSSTCFYLNQPLRQVSKKDEQLKSKSIKDKIEELIKIGNPVYLKDIPNLIGISQTSKSRIDNANYYLKDYSDIIIRSYKNRFCLLEFKKVL